MTGRERWQQFVERSSMTMLLTHRYSSISATAVKDTLADFEISDLSVEDATHMINIEINRRAPPRDAVMYVAPGGTVIKCAWCDNDARYIDEHGSLVCGVCPVKRNDDSIRISDVPKLVGWVRDLIAMHRARGYVELDGCDIDVASELIGVKPR